MKRKVKILASFLCGLLLHFNVSSTVVQCKSIGNVNTNIISTKTEGEYSEKTNKVVPLKFLKVSQLLNISPIELPPVEPTDYYVCLKTSINTIEHKKKFTTNMLLSAVIVSGIGSVFFKSVKAVENIVCTIVAIIGGYHYYLEKLPNDLITYREQYFRWTDSIKYKYEYKCISGFKDKDGNVLSKKTYSKTGNFDYLVNYLWGNGIL